MAGYVFVFSDIESLKKSIYTGVYSTILKIPNNNIWKVSHEGTFADYITMKTGDNVYFFSKRKIYGVGELININGDCKHLNFPRADYPSNFNYSDCKNQMILDESDENMKNRMVCTFRGAPYFFENGIDIDDVLTSNPHRFKMLRALWKLSFVKLGHDENEALLDVILQNNEDNIASQENIFQETDGIHNRIHNLVSSSYKVHADNIMESCSNGNGSLRHEMALEAGILDYIANEKTGVFGNWDYLSHQVIASPFKPIDYMDKMDIFGHKFIPGFKTISKYLVIEIKKGPATIEDINQLMKYVDWVNQEYSFGDYKMIEAFLVANSFSKEPIEQKNTICKRQYVRGRRPAISLEWNNVRLISYQFDRSQKKLLLSEVQ